MRRGDKRRRREKTIHFVKATIFVNKIVCSVRNKYTVYADSNDISGVQEIT